jgi:hypothetical protein
MLALFDKLTWPLAVLLEDKVVQRNDALEETNVESKIFAFHHVKLVNYSAAERLVGHGIERMASKRTFTRHGCGAHAEGASGSGAWSRLILAYR